MNARDSAGRTPLHFVCDHPKETVGDSIKQLMAGEIDSTSHNHRHMDMLANYLIEHGGDAEIRAKNGETCFAVACRRRNQELMRLVRSFDDRVLNAPINERGETCLHVECQLIEENIAKELLLDYYMDPNVREHRNRTALDLALDTNNLAVVPFLVYRKGTSSCTMTQKILYKIYKTSTEFFLNFLRERASHLFEGQTPTKTFVRAALEIRKETSLQFPNEREIHAHLITAISFRGKFNKRSPGGGNPEHRHFVKVLKDCETILFPPLMNQSGFDAVPESGIVYQSQSGIKTLFDAQFGERISDDQEDDDDDEYYPLSAFFDEDGACLDDDIILSMNTEGFFEEE